MRVHDNVMKTALENLQEDELKGFVVDQGAG